MMQFQPLRHSLTASIVGIALLTLTSCGAPGPINVTANDYAFQLSQPTVKSGKVNFKITNSGSVTHEFVIIQTDLAADKLPMKPDGSVDEEQLTSPGEQGDLEVGKSADLSVDLKPGHYLFICNLPKHYNLGMHTEFTVTQP